MPLYSRPYGFNKKKFYLPKPVHLFVPCGKGRPKGGKPLPGSGKIVLFKQKRRIGSRTAASPRRDPVPRFKSCKICVAPYRNEPPKKRSFFTKTDRLSVYGATLYPRPEKRLVSLIVNSISLLKTTETRRQQRSAATAVK